MTLDRTLGLLLVLAACGASSDDPPSPDAGASGKPAAGSLAAGSGGSSSSPAQGCPLTPPSACPEPKPSYADVKPIFEQRCYACHDGNHMQWPLTSYQHVADWFGEVRAQMVACTMPPASAKSDMTVSERMRILDWIRCGYPE